MTSRTEQLSAQFTSQFTAPLSAIGKTQLEAQLGLLQAFSSRALESTEQLISLNLRASRTSVEQVTGTFKQLLDATNPRDVIAAGSRAQGQWHYLFEYGRELLSIASGAPIQAWSTQPSPFFPSLQLTVSRTETADVAPAVAAASDAVSQVIDQVSIATADAGAVAEEIASAAAESAYTANTWVDEQKQADAPQVDEAQQKFEAAVETAIADDAPPVAETPLVQAMNEAAPKPASAEHPIASTIALEAHDQVELPVVTPVDAKPPVHTPTPPSAKGGRSSRSRK